MIHSALWMLMRLQVRAALRRMWQLTKTWKGRFILLVGFVMFGFWLLGSFVGTRTSGGITTSSLRGFGSLGLASLWFISLVFTRPEGGVVFRPAEVEFLFPAPISRRQLLLYRIICNSLISLPTAIIFSMFFARNTPMWLGAFLGIWLAFQLLSVSQMAWQLICGIAQQTFIARSRGLILTLLAIGIAVAAIFGLQGSRLSVESLKDLAETPVARVLLTPFQPYSATMAANGLGALAINGGIALAINLAIIALILRLDGNFMEASVNASQRLAQHMSKARRGVGTFSQGNKSLRGLQIPMLPRLGGAGPIAWHQFTGFLRSAGSMALLLTITSVSVSWPLLLSQKSLSIERALPVLVMLSIVVLPQFVRYDFRAEVDRMPVLKSLPLNPYAVVVGELITPILVVGCAQLGLLTVLFFIGSTPAWIIISIAAFVLPVDLITYEVENFLFLLIPFREQHSRQGITAIARVSLTMMLKFALMGVMAGLSAGIGGLVYYLTQNRFVALSIAWALAMLTSVAFLPAIVWAFKRFDPSSDRAL